MYKLNAIIQELIVNGESGNPEQLLAWFEGERAVIKEFISKNNEDRDKMLHSMKKFMVILCEETSNPYVRLCYKIILDNFTDQSKGE